MKHKTLSLLKRILQWFVVSFLLSVALVVLMIVFILPGPADIAKKLRPLSDSGGTVTPVQATQATLPRNAPVATAPDSSTADKEPLLNDLIRKESNYSNACETLAQGMRLLPAGVSNFRDTNFSGVYLQGLKENQRDPLLESVLPVVRKVLSLESFQKIFQMIREAKDDNLEDHSWMKKAEFYKTVYQVMNEMKAKKSEIESAFDRSYMLYMMARVAEKNPSFLQSAQAQTYCQDIERALNEGGPYQMNEESAEFQKFLEAAQVRPEDIGYDPHQKTNLKFEYSKGHIGLRSNWIDELFGLKKP